jgi:hypothetical protein
VTKFKLLRNLDVRMYGISPPLWAFLGAGDETRTRDSLLGRRSALCAVAKRSFLAWSCGFLLLPSERKLSSYGVMNGGHGFQRDRAGGQSAQAGSAGSAIAAQATEEHLRAGCLTV